MTKTNYMNAEAFFNTIIEKHGSKWGDEPWTECILNEDSFNGNVQWLNMDQGYEGHGEQCSAVFKYEDKYYKLEWNYYSYEGNCFDYTSLYEVVPVEKTVTAYEKV